MYLQTGKFLGLHSHLIFQRFDEGRQILEVYLRQKKAIINCKTNPWQQVNSNVIFVLQKSSL